jgi:hypothetical protein
VRRGKPHYWRAAIEMAVALGGGTAWYWIDRERQVADWDYPSWEQRLNLEAWRFDNNPFGINFIWHAMSGANFHFWSRANDLSLLASTGFGFATSMSWEYFLEFREKISINDAMVTTGSGVAIGEFVHWLGRYLNSAPAGERRGRRTARWTAGFPRAFHDRLDGRPPWRGNAPADELGFRSDIWHRFDFSYALSLGRAVVQQGDSEAVRQSPTFEQARFDGRLVALPGYLRPGRLCQFFRDGNVPSLRLSVTTDNDDTGVDLLADTVLLGQIWQDIPHADQPGVGRSVILGTSIAYQYRRERWGIWEDRLGILHFPGLALDADFVGRRWRARIGARGHGDFAGLHALPYERWKEANPDVQEKTILRKQGYYYGWGLSGRLSGELWLPRLGLGGSVGYGRYYSQEGYDRSQEDVTADVEASDSVLDYEVWLRVVPFGRRSYLDLHLGHQARRAELGGFRAEQDLRRYGLRLGYAF